MTSVFPLAQGFPEVKGRFSVEISCSWDGDRNRDARQLQRSFAGPTAVRWEKDMHMHYGRHSNLDHDRRAARWGILPETVPIEAPVMKIRPI